VDHRLRDLARAASQGDLQAEARLLLERVRRGELDEDRLRVAALLGDPAARGALGVAAAARDDDDDAAWLRGVAEVDPSVALWALAEGLASEQRGAHEGQVQERLRRGLADAVARGAAVSFALARDHELDYVVSTAAAKVLVVGLDHLGRDPHRVGDDDPDVVRALEDVRGRFGYLDPGVWSYELSIRSGRGGWAHVLRYTRRRGGTSPHTADAADGWAPPADAVRVRSGVLDGVTFAFADRATARAAIRAAVVPWLLSSRS
jgi:hypothetical protein